MTNRSPIHELLVENGARFTEHHGWEVVEDFGDPQMEYQAVRNSAAVFDLSYLGRLRVSGRDRVRFLNSLLSNDIKNLKTGTGCYATLLTHQGRMESDLYVYARPDDLLLECSPAGREKLLQSLRKYIVSDLVEIDELSGNLNVLSIQGPESAKSAAHLLDAPLDGMALLEFRVIERPSGNWIIARRDRTGCDGYDFWIPPADVSGAWKLLVNGHRLQPAGHRALNWLRTESGIPWFGADMDEQTLPMEMGLSSALSMTKGCYRGQEIVARVIYRGHLDKKLGGVSVDAADVPEKGAKVMAGGAVIGEVTSAVISPLLSRPLALAVLKTDFLSPGTRVEVAYESGTRNGEVVALPLS